jgi:UDP-N-acetylmuramoylalanine--D-glutamate ligase
MIAATTFSGKHVALFGLGGSGLATARALHAGGAKVSVWDDNSAARDKAVAEGFSVVDLSSAQWSEFQSFVLSPGVPLTHPEPHWTVKLAHAAGVEIIGDVEIFCRERAARAPGAPFIAITGTNGKSTTTALCAHVFAHAGFNVQMGGNIGTPILSLEAFGEKRIYVVELSTFQIDLTPSLAPSVGVLLNLTPDHIDRHGSMEHYAAIKERLVANAQMSVVGADDDYCRMIFEGLSAADRPVQAISDARADTTDCIYYDAGKLHRSISMGAKCCLTETLVDLSGVTSLRGAHNGQNAAAVFAVCDWLGVPHDLVGAGMKTFPGLAHRMEQVGQLGRVVFVNDSKATNADAAEKALLTFDPIYWIAGGKAKEGGIEPLRALFGRIAKAYLIGASAHEFANTLGAIPHEICGTLDVALKRAAADALLSKAEQPVVLLSPACASYDQFANFEKRGEAFRTLTRDLIAEAERGNA